MAESITVAGTTRSQRYQSLYPQLCALTETEPDMVANLANIAAALREAMNFFWIGFYIVRGGELVLGPFQGPVACTRIRRGKGVCGTAWANAETIVVEDVDQFPGHIACSSASRSEIVVPVKNANGEVVMVIDIDSDQLGDFGETDRIEVERIAALISRLHFAQA